MTTHSQAIDTNEDSLPAFLGGAAVKHTVIDNDSELPVLPASNVAHLPTPKQSNLEVITNILPSEAVTSTFRTAASTQGTVDNTASKQWANRPDDERYLDLGTMRTAIEQRFKDCRSVEINSDQLDFNPDMSLNIQDYDNITMTNWTYNQLCQAANAPVGYIKTLPSELASSCLKHGLANKPNDIIKALVNTRTKELRAINSATYGRIWDYQVIDQVMKIAGNGVNDTQWKIPGQINWESGNGYTVEYNPYVDITKENTTLYASDRDVFLFLVDDTHPIEIGKLPNGEPDLVFRGFYVSNSETGAGTFDMSCMLMRGVCQNRNIWGVEGKQSLTMRHSLKAPDKFAQQAFPMLAAYSMSPTVGLIAKVNAAKALIIANDDEERLDFLTSSKIGLSKGIAEAVVQRVFVEEQHPMTSLWDAVQGMTAHARTIQHQDARILLEQKAGKLMSKISA